MLKLFLHDMGWKNAPLASDEIYEAKIATTNLPPRHHTTIIFKAHKACTLHLRTFVLCPCCVHVEAHTHLSLVPVSFSRVILFPIISSFFKNWCFCLAYALYKIFTFGEKVDPFHNLLSQYWLFVSLNHKYFILYML